MYGLPENIDLSFLKGGEIEQVCIGANDLIFNMSNGTRITVLNKCFIESRESERMVIENFKEKSHFLTNLIGNKIQSIESKTDGTLALFLSGGVKLILIDDSKNFESYWLCGDGKEVIV